MQQKKPTTKPATKPTTMRLPKDSQWNLKALFASPKQAQSACAKAQGLCKSFAKSYEGRLDSLTPSDFEAVIREYESLCENLGRIMTYAFLLFAQDTTNFGQMMIMLVALFQSYQLSFT